MTGFRHFRETAKLWPAWYLQKLHAAAIQLVRPVTTATDTIVSLTSYPERFSTLDLCIGSLLRQSVLPERIILHLSEDEADAAPLPPLLTGNTGSLLEIRCVSRNTRSYKKIIPALERYPDKTIVTCDDDKIYPPNWLKHLLRAANETPGTIICHRARVAIAQSEQQWAAYRNWPGCRTSQAGMANVPIGSGGVLYPPGSLHPIVHDLDSYERWAPHADDLWLKLAAWKQGTPVRQVRHKPSRFNSIPVHGGHLSDHNLAAGGNDQVLRELASRFGFTPASLKRTRGSDRVPIRSAAQSSR